MATLEDDMTGAARDLLGSGYVPSYYRNAASEFIQIAEAYAGSQKRPPATPVLRELYERLVRKQTEARTSKGRISPGPTTQFFEGQLDVLSDVLEALKPLT